MPPRMTFGMSSELVNDTIYDEVLDALDSVAEEEWEVVSWRRSSATRFIVNAPVSARSICYDTDLKIKILPLGQMLDDMTNPRNEWLNPSTEERPAVEEAQEMVDQWMVNFWPEDLEPHEEPASATSQESAEPHPRPEMKVVKRDVEREVLQMFGINGSETDRDGNKFDFFKLAPEG